MEEIWSEVQRKRKNRGSSSGSISSPQYKKPWQSHASMDSPDFTTSRHTHNTTNINSGGFASMVNPCEDIGLDMDKSDTKTILCHVLDVLGEVRRDVKNIGDSHTSLKKQITHITTYIESVDDKLNACTTAIEILAEQHKTLAEETERKMKQLEESLQAQEDQMRKNNLIIYGIKEQDKEDWTKTEDLVRTFIRTDLKLDTEEMELERAHRLGKKTTGKDRPIIIRFLKMRQRNSVRDSVIQLQRDTGKDGRYEYRVSDDLSQQVRAKRAILYPKMMAARDEQKHAIIKHDKLYIDNIMYIVNDAKEIVKAEARHGYPQN